MISKRALLASAAGVLASPFLTTEASASIKWQMAIGAAETNFLGRIVREFVDEVKTETNGELDIALHSRASLLPHGQIFRGVRTGQVQAGKVLISIHGNEDPFFEVEGVPFLANTWEESYALRAATEPYVKERISSRGATEIFSVMWPSQGIYTQAPIYSVADLRGQRFRVYNPITTRMATLMDTRPLNVSAAETAQAFASGMAQSMFTSAQSGVDAQAWDYVKYFTDVGGMRNRSPVVVNTAAFNRLPTDIKRVVLKAAENGNKKGFDEPKKSEIEITLSILIEQKVIDFEFINQRVYYYWVGNS
jgi:TRAP-type C4-dicarboxylate transport system substrate-binding protein